MLKQSLLVLLIMFTLAACGGDVDDDKDVEDIFDTTPPVITLNGDSSVSILLGNSYIEMDATANDNIDGNVEVVISGTVDTSTIGDYTISYTATDSSNNVATATRTITVHTARPFITKWKTDNAGISDDNQIKIGTKSTEYDYDYDIDWGDGSSDESIDGDITHTYSDAGTYTIEISGEFPQIYFDLELDLNSIEYDSHDNPKLLSIEQWGDINWQSMRNAFLGSINLVVNATDAPNLTQVTDMSDMFSYTSAFNHDLGHWNVSSVTNMSGMFNYATAFNQDLTDWNVSSVTDMSYMFALATEFNRDLSSWNVSSVFDMSNMFYASTSFDQDISNWNVSSVVDMAEMFAGAILFDQDLSSWDVSSVEDMSNMYDNAIAFNQDISSWDVSSVEYMSSMYYNARAFNQDLSNWDITSVIDMEDMFTDVTLSTANYDALLIGWSAQNVQNDVIFSAGDSVYSTASQAARELLTDSFQWVITDGGLEE